MFVGFWTIPIPLYYINITKSTKCKNINLKSGKDDDNNIEVGKKKKNLEGREHWNDHSVSFSSMKSS